MVATARIRIEPIYATPLEVDKAIAEIGKALDETGKHMAARFTTTTAAWQGIAPEMKSEVEMGGEAAVWAGPDGSDEAIDKWKRLDEGVEPRVIAAKHGRYMKFLWQGPGQSYTASTKVRQFWSGRREKHGDNWYPKVVHHPGHEAREWSDEMIKQELEPFAKRVQAAIDNALD